MKRFRTVLGFIALCALAFSPFVPAFAQTVPLTSDDEFTDFAAFQPPQTTATAESTTARLVYVGLGFLGILSIIVILMGGFKFTVAQGSLSKLDEARTYIASGLVGLGILVAVWTITSYATNVLP